MITKQVCTVEEITDEGGKTKCAHHVVEVNGTCTFTFSERSVFDFGIAINPEYEIAPGMSGGLSNVDDDKKRYWMTFKHPIYQVGDEQGDIDFCYAKEKEFVLPEGYAVVKTVTFEANDFDLFFKLPEDCVKHERTRYNVTDPAGNKITMHGGSCELWGATADAAVNHAFWELAVKMTNRGGWEMVRYLTPEEDEAYMYVATNGIYAHHGVRM